MNKNFFDNTKDKGESLQSFVQEHQIPSILTCPTVLMGMSEEDVFKAIVAIGNTRFELKNIYVNNTPKDKNKLKDLEQTMLNLYNQQLMYVNDACARFKLVHPEMKIPPKDKDPNVRFYWDWYSEWHQKLFHTSVNPKSDAKLLIKTEENPVCSEEGGINE